MQGKKNIFKFASVCVLAFLGFLFAFHSVSAAVTVATSTAVSVSADQASTSATSIVGGITIVEGAPADITWTFGAASGTIILTAPSGFNFTTTSVPTISVTNGDIGLIGTTATMTPTTIQIAFSTTSTIASTIVIGSTTTRIGVKPTAGTPLASGTILRTSGNPGSATVPGVTNGSTNFATLNEVAGAANKLTYTTSPATFQQTNVASSTQPVVAIQDQFGNTLTATTTPKITLSPVKATDGVTAGAGSIVADANPLTATSGVATFNNLRYTSNDAIQFKATTNAGSFNVLSATTTFSSLTVATGTAATVIADQATSGATSTLGSITLTEQLPGDISFTGASGTIILTAPSGFNFSTTSAPSIAVTAGNIGLVGTTATTTATTIQIAFAAQSTQASTIVIGGTTAIGVKPTAGTPLAATGNIFRSSANGGSATLPLNIVTTSTNFTTLSEAIGAATLAFTTQPPSGVGQFGSFSPQPAVTIQDQFGNVYSSNSTSTITLSAVKASDGVTSGNGTLSVNTNPLTVTNGVATFSGVSYGGSDTIKLKASTNAGAFTQLSNSITIALSGGGGGGGGGGSFTYSDPPIPLGGTAVDAYTIRWSFAPPTSYAPDTVALYEDFFSTKRLIASVSGSATSILETSLKPSTTYSNRLLQATKLFYSSNYSAPFAAVTTLALGQPSSAPIPTPSPAPQPSPVPSAAPQVQPSVGALSDGDLARASNDFRVYIIKVVGTKHFKRWFIGPQMFRFYKHLGFANMKVVDPAVLAQFDTSNLIRAAGDKRIYFVRNAVPGKRADRAWIKNFRATQFDPDAVCVVNPLERNWYRYGGVYRP